MRHVDIMGIQTCTLTRKFTRVIFALRDFFFVEECETNVLGVCSLIISHVNGLLVICIRIFSTVCWKGVNLLMQLAPRADNLAQ